MSKTLFIDTINTFIDAMKMLHRLSFDENFQQMCFVCSRFVNWSFGFHTIFKKIAGEFKLLTGSVNVPIDEQLKLQLLKP